MENRSPSGSMTPINKLDVGLVGQTQIKRLGEKTAIKYRVVEEAIDLEALRQEKEGLEAMLTMPEPTTEELIEMGKSMHPYYQDREWVANRLEEINRILKG